MDFLIKKATIFDESTPYNHQKKDIEIKGGYITQIGEELESEGRVISFDNMCVSSGWADSSVCFGEPGFEEDETLENGIRVASKSGFTSLMINPCLCPVTQSKPDVVFLKKAVENSPVSIFPIGALTKDSKGERLAELYDMYKAGAVAFGDYKTTIQEANLMKIALEYVQPFGGIVISFACDRTIAGKGVVNEHIETTKLGLKQIPTLAEEIIVQRDLSILEYTGGKLHIPTISSAKTVMMIEKAKKDGLDVTCSVAVHNLHFLDSVLSDFNTNFKVMPPLRDKENVDALIEGVKKGVIDFVTSDHRPLNTERKNIEFDLADYGTIGLETAFPILNQHFDIDTTIRLLTRAKDRFGLPSYKIEKGQRADLTIFTTSGDSVFKQSDILSFSKNSAFLGEKTKGKVLGVISNNQLILNI